MELVFRVFARYLHRVCPLPTSSSCAQSAEDVLVRDVLKRVKSLMEMPDACVVCLLLW